MEELLQAQQVNGESIQTIIRNFKKDSADRKTTAGYFEERLRRLQESWHKFQEVDSQLRDKCKAPMTLEYFAEGYYDKISTLTSEYMQLFNEGVVRLKVQRVPDPITPIVTTPNPQLNLHDVSTDHQGVIRDIKARMATLIRILNGISSVGESQPRQYYIFKTNTIEEHWKVIQEKYYDMCRKCEDPSQYEFQLHEYYTLEDRVQEQLVELSIKTSESQQNTVPYSMPSTGSVVQSTVSLPKITIPRFDGNYLNWRQFHDLFLEMVEKQPIPAIQKMWYLKTNLSGEAERLISQLTLTEENYVTAWKTLQDRYNNKRVLVATLIEKILNQSPGTSTAIAIKSLHDTTKECLLALNNLGIDTSNWDAILLQLLNKKLDKHTHLRFIQSLKNPTEVPSIAEFLSFLEIQFQALEATGQKDRPAHKAISSVASSYTNNGVCQFCSTEIHKLFQCSKFLEISAPARLQWVQKHKLCVNCLKPNHTSQTCNSRSCLKCSKKHNTLLHLEKKLQPAQQSSKNVKPEQNKSSSNAFIQPSTPSTSTIAVGSAATNAARARQGYVLLASAKVTITAPNGSSSEFRAILDSGSQINIVSKRLIQKLCISPTEASLCIDGIGEIKKKSNHRINVRMTSRDSKFSTDLEAYVLPMIVPPQPDQHINISTWNIPSNIPLADPQFNRRENIDILLGAEVFYSIIQGGTIQLGKDLPRIQNTSLGWIIGGTITNCLATSKQGTSTCAIFSSTNSLDENIEQLWKLDEVQPTKKLLSPSDEQCERHFIQHVYTNQDGRFVVSIPFRENPTALGDSHRMAYNRFMALERRISRDKQLRSQYIQFMREYEQLGHMQKVEIDTVGNNKYFIPHHCVLKPDSTTTKLRVVFDASAKTSSGHSLNDVMYSGPTIQSDLFSILLRFRLKKFVFVTDIEKMYRQILINSNDHQYQLIIWREDPGQPISYFKLNTVTYGTRAAPYLATRCLQKIAEENAIDYPYGSQCLQDNFYVDDGLGGSDSLNTAIRIQDELITILKRHGFLLKKWCSNHPQLLKGIPISDQEINFDFNEGTTIKTLGLSWHPKSDYFRIKAKLAATKGITKRIATSDLARVFDPLGILAPVVVRAKIFIQHLWQQKIDWDEPLSENLNSLWNSFRSEFDNLNDMEIPRHIFKGELPESLQLHIFSDASEKAFGAAAYIRATLKNGRIIVNLLCAKSRVAPLKQQTLPRLELCAAVVAAQLSKRIQTDLQIKNLPTYLWTDSEIVLSWINSQSTIYNTFVANRIANIQSLTLVKQWHHVSSKDNPADILSRGSPATKIRTCNLWFYGPLFLHGKEELWPSNFSKKTQCDIERKKPKPITINIVCSDDFIYKIQHGNSFRKLQRILGFVLRFIKNLKINKTDRPQLRALTPIELDESLFTIIRAIQRVDFSSEIKHLERSGKIDRKSPIVSLTPFLDEEKILRVGGRLNAATLPYDTKHPMLVPYNDPLIKLLFIAVHDENNHCGPQALLHLIRERFWPIKGKIMARSTVQKCIRCVRAQPQLCQQLMGNLPKTRVTPARPFINSGVDYCGPFWIHYKIRGKKPTKAYIAIFCCFTTKAVHLELVSDLTTEAFVGALKRFISRRGRCKNLYSDNATNFIGAKNQLSELADTIYSKKGQELIASAASERGIQFHFIPPRAPHFGGLWEAAVKSAKHLLVRSVASTSLTYEELETIIVEIEAVLNSRPLTPMSNDPNDLTALTPGHFLIGEPLTSQVDSKAAPNNSSKLSHWKLLSHIKMEFWKRWSSEYLHELQQRHKWTNQGTSPVVGDMVIVKEDNLPIMEWPLARVTRLYPGDDKILRVVEVKTSKGLFKRPIHRLALLPIEQNSESVSATCDNDKSFNEDTSNSNEEPKAKRHKSINNHLSLMLLTILLMLQLAFGAPVEKKRFSKGLGIHFEHLGTIALSNTEWNLIVYYDLKPYWAETAKIVNGTKCLLPLCKMMRPNISCGRILNHFEQLEQELQLENRLLRTKRGALDIVGNVAHSLFGVLDAEYANQMSQTILKIKDNESYLLKLLKNQTSVIDSTINIVKQNLISTNTQFEHVESELKLYADNMNLLNGTLTQIQLSQLFNSAVLELALAANNVQKIQSSILDTLIDTHHGKISPLLLSPQQLKNEISQVKGHLPPSLNFPVAKEEELLKFFELMKVKGGLTREHAIFKITLPLIESEEFKLIYLTPVPNIINNTMVKIKTCSNVLGINEHREQFIRLSTSQLNTCETINPDRLLCTNVQIRYEYGSEICSCELSLFNNKTYTTCNIEKTTTGWTSLNHRNQWIYATLLSSHATAVCNREIIPITVKGSGLLTLDPECILKHNFAVINGRQTISSIVKASYTSLYKGTNFSVPTLHTQVPSNNQSNSTNSTALYSKNLKQLNTLQNSLNENAIMQLPNELITHKVHSYIISSLAIFLSLVTLITAIILYKKSKSVITKESVVEDIELSTNSTPVPMPRTQPKFTLDV